MQSLHLVNVDSDGAVTCNRVAHRHSWQTSSVKMEELTGDSVTSPSEDASVASTATSASTVQGTNAGQ